MPAFMKKDNERNNKEDEGVPAFLFVVAPVLERPLPISMLPRIP